MKQLHSVRNLIICFINVIALGVMLFVFPQKMKGQELPPRPMTVTVNLSQNLSFGAFYIGGSGGSVIIYENGSRSQTGDVVLLNMAVSFSAALYDAVANPGTIVSILKGADAVLTGNNGGSMILKTDNSGPFVITSTPPSSTLIRTGGTLIVGNTTANPPGNYSGSFNVTFVQE